MKKNQKYLFYSIFITVIGLLITGLGSSISEKFLKGPDYSFAQYIIPIIILFIFTYLIGDFKYMKNIKNIYLVFIYILPFLVAIGCNIAFNIIFTDAGLVKNIGIRFIAVCIYSLFIAIYEEVLFRNIILHFCEKAFDKLNTAVLVSSILFALFHLGNITYGFFPLSLSSQLIYTLIIGLYLGAVYVLTNNIYICILCHFILDFSSLLGMLLDLKETAPTDINITSFVISIAVILPCLIVYLFFKRKINIISYQEC